MNTSDRPKFKPAAFFDHECSERERLDCHRELRAEIGLDKDKEIYYVNFSFGKIHNCQKTHIQTLSRLCNHVLEKKWMTIKELGIFFTGTNCERLDPEFKSCIDTMGKLMIKVGKENEKEKDTSAVC